ncbi:MAG TPA: ABC transporter permease [Bryobacteraceae bacterium]|nr:ABC transporter permease [Bryobacteraceae bacterium]
MNRLRALFLAPSVGFTVILFLIPLSIIIGYSFQTRGVYGGVTAPWTLENYQRLFDPLYGLILWRSLVMALLATALCLLIAFPLALFIARAEAKWKSVYLYLVILPFWTSFLVRTYAWMFLLRDTGLINSLLLSMGLIREPLPLLYNETAVVVGLVYGFLPFAVLPLFSNLERLDKNLLEAAADLGATPWETLRHVVLPMCAPGLRAAGVLVFIPCLGSYLTPDLLGGGKSIMIGNLIQNQFTTARDWPFGAAISLALMALVMILMVTVLRQDAEDSL